MKCKVVSVFLCLVFLFCTFPFHAQADAAPFKLDTPSNLTAELKKDSDGVPYFELKVKIPESVLKLAKKIDADTNCFEGKMCDYIEIEFEYKYGKYGWNEGPSMYWNTSAYVTDLAEKGAFSYHPFDSSTSFESIDIKAETYVFRARFTSMWGYADGMLDYYIYSGYSNIVTIGNPAYWSTASDWATPELQKAAEAGLIPGILSGADMTKPINREEFAELAVLLYEKTTGKSAVPAANNPFKDTSNKQILKAYQLKITTGTSATTFAPKLLINREQCAAMLFRTIKAIKPEPDGNFNIAGVKAFPDQKQISSWAVESALYMSGIGVIKGDSKGNFMPKATTSAQEAAGFGMATREAAVLMSVRTYEKMK